MCGNYWVVDDRSVGCKRLIVRSHELGSVYPYLGTPRYTAVVLGAQIGSDGGFQSEFEAREAVMDTISKISFDLFD